MRVLKTERERSLAYEGAKDRERNHQLMRVPKTERESSLAYECAKDKILEGEIFSLLGC